MHAFNFLSLKTYHHIAILPNTSQSGSIPLDILENGFRFLTRRFPLYLYIWFVTLSAAIANSCKTIKIMDNNAIDLRRSGQA